MLEPVDDDGDGSRKKVTVTVFGRELPPPKRKTVAAGLGVVCALAVGSQGQDGEPVGQEQLVAATEDEGEETYEIQVGAKADGWVEGESSLATVHMTSESDGIDYYHAYSGSIGESFYQDEPFWVSDDVNVLYARFEMNPSIALFIIPLIRVLGSKYGYTNKWKSETVGADRVKLPCFEVKKWNL